MSSISKVVRLASGIRAGGGNQWKGGKRILGVSIRAWCALYLLYVLSMSVNMVGFACSITVVLLPYGGTRLDNSKDLRVPGIQCDR